MSMLPEHERLGKLGLPNRVMLILQLNKIETASQLFEAAVTDHLLKMAGLQSEDIMGIERSLASIGPDIKFPRHNFIHELGLSNRAYNILRRHYIVTIEQLMAIHRGELFMLKGIGSKTREEIEDCLNELDEHYKLFIRSFLM